jgi:hypothetical protein
LPFYCQYMYSLLLLVAKNVSRFVMNNDIYTINTRLNINLLLPSINLSKYKNGVYCMGIEIFNHLPRDIRVLLYDANKFKLATKNFLLRESFYSIKEYVERYCCVATNCRRDAFTSVLRSNERGGRGVATLFTVACVT